MNELPRPMHASTPVPHQVPDIDASRWEAVCTRNGEHDGAFVYAVTTTGVYCRPSCPSRRPHRRNVVFFALTREARTAGYRPCRRCRPDEPSPRQRAALAVEAACRMMEAPDSAPPLRVLAAEAGMSAHHFHRVFKAHTGLTPKAYGDAARMRRVTEELGAGGSPTAAAFASGFGSLSRFYDAAAARLGMLPSALKAGARGEVIVMAQGRCRLGIATVAFTRRGVCAVRLTDDAQAGRDGLAALYRHALLVDGGAEFDGLVAQVIAAINEPAQAAELPLDIRGTAFQERVWAALRAIPIGTTASYSEIAAAIGAPTAHRAVAQACGANRLAVLIPCHRVVRADGRLSGYRWGTERKRALIAVEAARASTMERNRAASRAADEPSDDVDA